jgi:hypothetical protein
VTDTQTRPFAESGAWPCPERAPTDTVNVRRVRGGAPLDLGPAAQRRRSGWATGIGVYSSGVRPPKELELLAAATSEEIMEALKLCVVQVCTPAISACRSWQRNWNVSSAGTPISSWGTS